MSEIIQYHVLGSCNNCGEKCTIITRDGEEGVIYEATTHCKSCDFYDNWAYGLYESMVEGYDSCRKYTVGNG